MIEEIDKVLKITHPNTILFDLKTVFKDLKAISHYEKFSSIFYLKHLLVFVEL